MPLFRHHEKMSEELVDHIFHPDSDRDGERRGRYNLKLEDEEGFVADVKRMIRGEAGNTAFLVMRFGLPVEKRFCVGQKCDPPAAVKHCCTVFAKAKI
jgi:hypothetical protein